MNDHNPDGLTPEQVGEGWRLLRKGEHVSTTWGDEVWLHRTWDKSQWTGHVVGSNNATYRRRVAPTPAPCAAKQPADQSARIAYDAAPCTNHFSDGSKIFPNRDCCDPKDARIAELERQLSIERGEVAAGKSIVKDLDEEVTQLKRRVQELTKDMLRGNAEHEKQLDAKDDALEKAEATLAQVTVDRWKPIATAPKDGTHFLAGWFVDEEPDPERFTVTVAFYGQILGNHLLSSPGKYQIGPQVTHWQPLPQPPQ